MHQFFGFVNIVLNTDNYTFHKILYYCELLSGLIYELTHDGYPVLLVNKLNKINIALTFFS
jgi:hypothetical protein